MTESDARRIQAWIDSALEVFQRNQGDLAPTEMGIRTMLGVARSELENSLPDPLFAAPLVSDAAATA